MPTNMDDTITMQGSSVEIYRESEGALDDYLDPIPTWSKQATETAWIQSARGSRSSAQVIESIAGTMDVSEYIGFFKSDTVVQKGDYVKENSTKYDVVKAEAKKTFGVTSHIEASLKLITEG